MNDTQTVEALDVMSMFDDFLDECYKPVMIAGSTFYPSTILAKCDPIAYRIALNEYADDMEHDGFTITNREDLP